MNYSSKLIENAVNEISKLPGIGRRAALRLSLFLLRIDPSHTISLAKALIEMRDKIKRCKECFNLSDDDICKICKNHNRDRKVICVVSDIRDVIAIENTSQYRGIYHVLGGVISPLDGISPSDLFINQLIKKIIDNKDIELIFALPATIEGETTSFYIYKKVKDYTENITTIVRGISIDDDIEYADEVSLGRSIINRIPYEKDVKR